MPAITVSNSTATGSTADISNFTTGSITCNANSLYLCSVTLVGNPQPAAPNLTGAGQTWTQVATQAIGGTVPGRLTLFRALSSSPGAGATLNVDTAGSNFSGCLLYLDEVTNVDTSGTNGAGAIVQSNTATSTSTNILSVAQAAFADATNNGNYAAGCATNTSTTFAAGGGFTITGGTPTFSTPFARALAEFRVGQQSSSNASFTCNSAAPSAIIAVELKYSASGGGVAQQSTSLRNAMYRRRRRS